MTPKELIQNMWFLATRIAATKGALRWFYPSVALGTVLIAWVGWGVWTGEGFGPTAAIALLASTAAATVVGLLIVLAVGAARLGPPPTNRS